MQNSFTVGKKMFLIGVILVVGVFILGGNSYWTNRRVNSATNESMLRSEQLETVRSIQLAQIALMLDAMDSIVDKDDGKISIDRMASINQHVKLVSSKLDHLDVLADHEDEKKLARRVRADFQKLAGAIQGDLVRLIESKASEEEFSKFDNIVDSSGEQIEKDLASIAASVQEEQKEANEELTSMLAQSSVIGFLTFILTFGISLPVIYLISRSIVNPISNSIWSLNEGAEQVASASGQVSSASHSLAEGSSEQAASIEETSSSLEEMASMTKQNASHAGEADGLMKDSKQIIDKANGSMKELTASMEEISKASEETQKIVKTIDEIAFQTNLLALNAAVEAARAGEAGSGFAVVADEVRNLAMRAADAAKNTSDLIEGTVKKIGDGSGLVTRTNEAFTEVTASTLRVGELVADIAAASSEQAQGIDQVNTAVADVDKVTQQNAASAEESASASQEMNAQAEQMKHMVAKLSVMVKGSGVSQRKSTHSAPQTAVKQGYMNEIKLRNPQSAARQSADDQSEVNPEMIIPLDDDDFKDF
jgi:methyl-accepting chemotaxis protein